MTLIDRIESYLTANTDRHNTKWLKSRDSDLWEDVVNATSFLPPEAKPKQRIWHVVNEVTSVPTCPVTGENVKWHDDRYLTYISHSALASCPEIQKKKQQTYAERTGFTGGHWKNNPGVKTQCRETFAASKAKGLHKKVKRSDTWRAKVQATWDEKFNKDELAAFQVYRTVVDKITRREYRKHKETIHARSKVKERGDHLDHIFSVSDGWKNKVPAEVVGHWTNLRILNGSENMSKNSRSDKTLEELYNDAEFTIG